MSFDISSVSIAHWFPETEKHRCGYCSNANGSISNGMWAETLTVDDYQDLIDRGWRRSGKYCYKPIMSETCCPQYTIKCDATNISLSKSQKKVIKKFNKYLEDGVLNKKDFLFEPQSTAGSSIVVKDCPNIDFAKINRSEGFVIDQREAHDSDGNEPQYSRLNENVEEVNKKIVQSNMDINSEGTNMKMAIREGIGADSSKPPCKKAKLLRLERKKEKLIKRGLSLEKKEHVETQKTLEQFLEEISDKSKHKLWLELIPVSEPDIGWEQVKEIEFQLYRKYQIMVHNDPPTKLSMKGFNKFLVHSPLKAAPFPNDIDGPGYGSFHQQYWIDDKLVAVGVIDILPRCVSSVYFFYDPDFRNLTLGTYGALREVQFTRRLQRQIPELSNYYMGFYIHSCPKMRYKGKLVPSFLACPETYRWMPIEKCVEKLNVEKYSRLDDNIDAVDENIPTMREIEEIKVVYNYKLMYVRNYKRYQKEQHVFQQIGQLVGRKCTKKIVFCIN